MNNCFKCMKTLNSLLLFLDGHLRLTCSMQREKGCFFPLNKTKSLYSTLYSVLILAGVQISIQLTPSYSLFTYLCVSKFILKATGAVNGKQD